MKFTHKISLLVGVICLGLISAQASAAAWLFGSGLIGLAGLHRRRSS